MSATSTSIKHENVNKEFSQHHHFTVHQPGLLQNGNILLLIDSNVKNKLNDNLGTKLCDGLRNIGVNINQCSTVVMDNVINKENILEIIRSFADIKYFLLIGNNSKNNAVTKSVKLETDIRGNYKDYKKVIRLKRELFLEINRQCRGVNFPCPTNFPKDTAFVHFILSPVIISCATNATKFEKPHVMLNCNIENNTNFVQVLEKLCCKLTGKLQDKCIHNFVVTFENYLSPKCSEKIAALMYETVSKWIAFANIGIAEITLEKKFRIWNNKIKSCEAMLFNGNLNSMKILEMLELCRKCSDLGINQEEETGLPEHVRLCFMNYSNVAYNYKELPVKTNFIDSDDDGDDFVLPKFFYPKIKHRNHVIMTEDEDFTLI